MEKRRKLASLYREYLKDINGITTQPEMAGAKNVFWLYSILIEQDLTGIDRDLISNKLSQSGVDNRRFFYPAHVMPPYQEFAASEKFPVSDRLSNTGMNLPSSANLVEEDVNTISEVLRGIISKKN